MTHAEIYPKADHTTQWAQNNFARGTFSTVEKLLLHSTETRGYPSYGAGCTDAPTVTYHAKDRTWRQHNYIGSSARSLEDPSTTAVRENRDNVVQVEIVAYSDKVLASEVGGLLIRDLSQDNLRDLGEFAGWLNIEWGLPLVSTVTWKDYPASYGLTNGVRLTSSGYDSYRGLLGHEHASGNHHGDPGTIAVVPILSYAKAYVAARTGVPAPTVPVSRTTVRGPLITVANVRPGARNGDVRVYNSLLWKAQSATYRAAMSKAWEGEPADLYGPVAQKVTLDFYKWLHGRYPTVWGPAPLAPAWPGPSLIRLIGGTPR